MAKKKANDSGLIALGADSFTETGLSVVGTEQIEKILVKKFGGILHNSDYITGQRKQIVSISPAFDIAFGGGIPEGSMVVLTGDPKIGKTVTALSFCANAQKQGRTVFFGNIEGRLKERDILGIDGLQLSDDLFRIIGSTKDQILSGEDYLNIFDVLIHSVPRSVCLIDSFSALCSRSELESDFNAHQVAPIQKTLSKFCRKISNTIPIHNNIVIGITHQMANINPMSRTAKIEKSGTGLQYQTDVKLKAIMMKHLYEGSKEDGKIIGQTVTWKVMTSAIGPPGMQFDSYIKYGHGVWKEMELIDIAIQFDIIKQSGSWLTYRGDEKIQGKVKLAALLECESELYNDIKNTVYDMLGFPNEI